MSQIVFLKDWFAVFKVKITVKDHRIRIWLSDMSSERLILLQLILVWWHIIVSWIVSWKLNCSDVGPRGFALSWWECYGLCLNTNQPSLPTLFYYVLVSVSVFAALSTVFPINSPEKSAFSPGSSGLISTLSVFSTTYLCMKFSLSSDEILCGWPGLKHQLTD